MSLRPFTPFKPAQPAAAEEAPAGFLFYLNTFPYSSGTLLTRAADVGPNFTSVSSGVAPYLSVGEILVSNNNYPGAWALPKLLPEGGFTTFDCSARIRMKHAIPKIDRALEFGGARLQIPSNASVSVICHTPADTGVVTPVATSTAYFFTWRITYDGAAYRFYMDGGLIRTVTVAADHAAGLSFGFCGTSDVNRRTEHDNIQLYIDMPDPLYGSY